MLTSEKTIWINTHYCCAVVFITNGIIVDAAPIFYWTIGKNEQWLKQYLTKKKVLISWKEISC